MSMTMTMPKIGVNMVEATIIEWMVKEGDSVQEGDVILSAETDKAVQEIPASMSGTIGKLLAEPGQLVQCQEPIALILEPGEAMEDVAADRDKTKVAAPAGTAETGVSKGSTGGDSGDSSGGARREDSGDDSSTISSRETKASGKEGRTGKNRVRISPLAKKIAKDNGIDINDLEPEKPGNRIVKADVLRHLSESPAKGKALPAGIAGGALEVPAPSMEGLPAARSKIPVTGTRKVIADRLTYSARSAVRSVLFAHAEAERLIEWRKVMKKKGAAVSYNDLLMVLVSRALQRHPIMNARWGEKEIELVEEHNIGVAVDTQKGLAVPVVHNVQRKSLEMVAAETAEKIVRAQEGKSTQEDLTGGTFTISNLGMYDVDLFLPVINPPECAILGVGSIQKEPVVNAETDVIESRAVMGLSLAFDHRIVDGAPAARFLQTIKQFIEQPLHAL